MDPAIEKRFTTAAAVAGYPKDSLVFVLQTVPQFAAMRHDNIDGSELCWRLHDYSLLLFGENARQRLGDWNITTTSDFGKIVVALIEHGFIQESETYKLDDFEAVFKFDAEFTEPRNTNARPLRQWNLFSLFIATTLSAIAISGFSRGGFDGVVPALFSSWFVFLGVFCIYEGIKERSLFLASTGAVSLTGGLFYFFGISN